uniref:Uncharacterized protein n=1 Tax=Romanomermis culicivorax TaxID=13658 RepID=A0A915KL07_ROMCU
MTLSTFVLYAVIWDTTAGASCTLATLTGTSLEWKSTLSLLYLRASSSFKNYESCISIEFGSEELQMQCYKISVRLKEDWPTLQAHAYEPKLRKLSFFQDLGLGTRSLKDLETENIADAKDDGKKTYTNESREFILASLWTEAEETAGPTELSHIQRFSTFGYYYPTTCGSFQSIMDWRGKPNYRTLGLMDLKRLDFNDTQ